MINSDQMKGQKMDTQRNPWIEGHIHAETDFQDGDRRLAKALVLNEYRGAPDPVPCDCGGQAFYKATIGAMKCPTCGDLYDTQGDKI
jgi:hypothetical protein